MELDFVTAVRSESARFAEVLGDLDPSGPVPTCPDWTVADLIAHLAQVQSFWTTIVAERRAAPPPDQPPEPDLVVPRALARSRATTQRLVEALAGAEPGEPVWTWHDDDRTVGFVRRRQAHEALIHRLDAEVAAGAARAPIDAELASDGIDEVLTVMFGGAPPWASVSLDGPVGRIRTVDTGRSWLVRIGHFDGVGPESGTQYADEPMLQVIDDGPASFTVSAPAADLDAWLWNRPALTAVEVDGDGAALLGVIRSGVH